MILVENQICPWGSLPRRNIDCIYWSLPKGNAKGFETVLYEYNGNTTSEKL